jgi:hypothetical protein
MEARLEQTSPDDRDVLALYEDFIRETDGPLEIDPSRRSRPGRRRTSKADLWLERPLLS